MSRVVIFGREFVNVLVFLVLFAEIAACIASKTGYKASHCCKNHSTEDQNEYHDEVPSFLMLAGYASVFFTVVLYKSMNDPISHSYHTY